MARDGAVSGRKRAAAPAPARRSPRCRASHRPAKRTVARRGRECGAQLGPQLDPRIRDNALLRGAPLESRDQGGVVGVAQHDAEVGPEAVRQLPHLGALARIAERRIDGYAPAATQPARGITAQGGIRAARHRRIVEPRTEFVAAALGGLDARHSACAPHRTRDAPARVGRRARAPGWSCRWPADPW